MLTDTLRDPLRPTFAFAAFDEKRPTEAGAQDAWPAFLASFPEDVFTIDGTRTKPLAKAFGFAHRRVFCPAAVMSLIDAAPFTMRLEARAGEPGADPVGLLYVVSGKLSVIQSEQTRRLGRNEALIFDPSQPMTVTCQEDTQALLILVSTQYFLTHVGVQPRLLDRRQLSASRGVNHAFLLQTLRHFAQELPRIDPSDTAEFCDGIFCFLRPMASEALREHASLEQNSRDARRTEALLIMERRFTDPTLTSGAIADLDPLPRPDLRGDRHDGAAAPHGTPPQARFGAASRTPHDVGDDREHREAKRLRLPRPLRPGIPGPIPLFPKGMALPLLLRDPDL